MTIREAEAKQQELCKAVYGDGCNHTYRCASCVPVKVAGIYLGLPPERMARIVALDNGDVDNLISKLVWKIVRFEEGPDA